MKKIAFILLCLSVAILSSCGSSDQDAAKIKREQDSMSKIEGNNIIDKFNQQLSLDTSKSKDTTAKKETKEKK